MTVQALWCAVLLQALTDGLNSLPVREYFSGADTEVDARSYILVPNPDFDLVCQFAGVEPEAVRRDFRFRLARKDPMGPREAWEIPKSARKLAAKSIPTFTHQGRSLTLREWSEVSGISRELLMERVNRRGWSISRALTEPVGRRMPKPSRSDPTQARWIAERLTGFEPLGRPD